MEAAATVSASSRQRRSSRIAANNSASSTDHSSPLRYPQCPPPPASSFNEDFKQNSLLRRATTIALEKSLNLTRQYAALWIGLVISVLIVRQFFSDGGFSSSLTLSSGLQCFGYLLAVVKVVTQYTSQCPGCSGISVGSLVLTLISLVTRLYPNLFFYGYLPVDKSGDWLYQCVDVCSFVLVCILLIVIHASGITNNPGAGKATRARRTSSGVGGGPVRSTGVSTAKVGGGKVGKGGGCAEDGIVDRMTTFVFHNWLECCVVCLSLALAIFIHAGRNRNLVSDVCWAFSVYLESFVMLPQLLLMTKQASADNGSGDIDKLTAHYIASMAAANIACLLFWWKTSRHLVPKTSNSRVGWAVFLAVVFRNLVMVDYVYHYVRAMVTGQRLTLRRWSSCNV
eukprot:GHVS01000307.1.p1 GENE.GHVS01000307.1~~GHVS01000307.1.p1  ORF type:complete len:410 (+),score=63.02 GHVS01000307.1:42-1232(+)